MKKLSKLLSMLLGCFLLTGTVCIAQSNATAVSNKEKSPDMKMYVIERVIPGAGQFTPAKLKTISETSCTVLKEMGPQIQWLHSYVTGDKIFCIYKAENVELIREHAKKGGFPVNAIYEVSEVISPATAN